MYTFNEFAEHKSRRIYYGPNCYIFKKFSALQVTA